MKIEKIEFPCPCGGRLKWKRGRVVVDEVDCGMLDVEYCQRCGEEYLPDDSMEIVERKLKDKGLWGIQREEVNLWKSGSSVVLRIPKSIAEKFNLKPDEKVIIYPEGKNKLIIQV